MIIKISQHKKFQKKRVAPLLPLSPHVLDVRHLAPGLVSALHQLVDGQAVLAGLAHPQLGQPLVQTSQQHTRLHT